MMGERGERGGGGRGNVRQVRHVPGIHISFFFFSWVLLVGGGGGAVRKGVGRMRGISIDEMISDDSLDLSICVEV